MPLTDAQIRRTKATVKAVRLYDGDGMYLVVQPQGGRSWRFDYRFQGTRKGISLGTYPEVSLALARERRTEARRLVAEGLDPSQVRQAAKRGPVASHTFDAVAAEWLAKQATKWATSTTEKATYHLSLPSPWIGRRPIGSIEPPELLDVLRDIESRGHIETAHNVKQRVGQVFRYAIATGRATRDPSGDLRGALTPISRQHRAALTAPDDIRTLLRAIAGYHGSRVVHVALQMLPLVFVRPGELRLARWSEFTLNPGGGLWRIPAERMKHREPHLVPLSRQVVRLLSDLHRFTGPREGERPENTLVFPSRVGRRTPISENTLNGALRRLGFGSRDMSAHGFRTLASTRLHEMGWNTDVIERQLAHRDPNTIRAVYNRAQHLEERRTMMQAWADHLAELESADKSR